MRILHFITSLRTGGAERLVTDLLPRFRDAGHEVSLLLMDGTRTPLYEELERRGIRPDALSTGWRSMRNPLLINRLKRYLKEHPTDILHTHNTACQLLAAAAARHLPVALVTTEHNTTNRRRNWKGFRPVDRWMYRQYRQIICVGEETRSRLLAYLDNKDIAGKTQVVPNGIDLSRFRDAVPDPEILALPGYKVTMVAAFRPQKDHATLIRAMQFLPEEYRLLLAGGAETREDKRIFLQCRELVSRLGLGNRVRFLGIRQDIPELLAASDVIVLSTHHEGFGLTAVEAMASGKVLILSDLEVLRNVAGNTGVFFPCGDAEELARLIRQGCEDLPGAETVRKRCRTRAEMYGIGANSQAYLDIYRKVFNLQS